MPLRLATTHCGHAPAGSGTVCLDSRTIVHTWRDALASPTSKHAGNVHGGLVPALAPTATKRRCAIVRTGAALQSSATSTSGTPARSANPRNAGTIASSPAASAAKKSSAVALDHACFAM
jgi:hypothetical protein